MPNTLAQLVLYSWPLVTWFLFSRMRTGPALVSTILLGYLFIPERVGFDLPVLPPLTKHLMPALCALVALMLKERHEAGIARRAARRQAIAGAKSAASAPGYAETAPEAITVTTPAGIAGAPRGRTGGRNIRRRSGSRLALFISAIVTVLMLNVLMTWMTNQQTLYFPGRAIPGIRLYDVGMLASIQIMALLPLLLGARHLRTPEAQVDVLKVLAWCGLAYSFLVLYESRMSPKLNIQLYGFFAHDWRQHLRNGYRPIVFLEHGLRVGIFVAMAALAAAVLARINAGGHRWRWLALALWLLFVLPISRNLGATMLALGLMPVILLLPVRLQFLVGLVIAAMVLVFPLVRGAGLIPADRIVAAISNINEDRASSFDFRLHQEDKLLERANEKPISGWGGWGRARVFNAETGQDESITDGVWIIVIGEKGWIGYLGMFGLLCLPAVLAALRYRRYGLGATESGLIIVLCANLIDLIPNSSLVPPIWLIAGALWGRLEQASARTSTAQQEQDDDRALNGRPVRRRRAPGPARREPLPYPAKSTPSKT